MKENEKHADYFYGDFTEPKEPKVSKRSPEVALSAIEKCQQLTEELNTLARLVEEKELEINRLKEENVFLRRRIDVLKEI